MKLSRQQRRALYLMRLYTLNYTADVRVRKRYTWTEKSSAAVPKDHTVDSLHRLHLVQYISDDTGRRGKFRVSAAGRAALENSCETCGGSGVIEDPVPDSNGFCSGTINCPTCKGTGKSS